MCVSLARARSSRRSVSGFMLVLLLRLRLALGGDAVALVVAGKFCALSLAVYGWGWVSWVVWASCVFLSSLYL